MIKRDPLRRETELDKLESKSDHQLRGFRFQDLLRNRLIESRFEVYANPQVTKPRQSDLLATDGDTHFLIEAKWVSRKINSGDIDDLRNRIARMPGSVVGCIFSMSPYAPTAIQCLEMDRRHEILLFQADEIHGVFRETTSFEELIKKKRKVFRVDGKVWFKGDLPSRIRVSRGPLPASTRGIELNGKIVKAVEDRTGLDHIIFTPHHLELGWQAFGGYGVHVHFTLNIETISELRDVFELLHCQLKLSQEGSFTISQLDCNWHGFGIENLLLEITRWKQRYKKAKLNRIHHSEDISYFDVFRGGFLMVSARQGVLRKAHFHQSEVDIILPGIPVDTRPLVKICELASRETPVFAPRSHDQLERVRFRPPIPLKLLQRITFVDKSRDRSVCGIIVENPFKKNKLLIPKSEAKHSAFYRLQEPTHLICSLSDWHGIDDVASRYHLKHLEVREVGEVAVINSVATWVSIINKKRPPHATSAQSLLNNFKHSKQSAYNSR